MYQLTKYMWKWERFSGGVDDLPDWLFGFTIRSKRRFGFSRWFTETPFERLPCWLKDALGELGRSLSGSRRAGGAGWILQWPRPLVTRVASRYSVAVAGTEAR
jgi:hypothetical protein